MKNEEENKIVPQQYTGKPIDTQRAMECADTESARHFFKTVKQRLAAVNRWHQLGGKLTATFQLVDAQGNEVDRAVQKGDYLKVDIPGPGTVSGEGYDWVQVEEVEEHVTAEKETFGFRVRPAQNPLNKDTDIAHFYAPESTSSFTVTREEKKITAAIFDRNTKVNRQAESVTDKIRDAVVGTAGILSFSKIQWKALAEGLLQQ